ncbi:MAG: hypothetical protein M1401_12130 [Chloroflexi bacterium]|nr:hypothetical protein [Chloroflexota bacterium]
MSADGFRALVVDRAEKGVNVALRRLDRQALPEGDVTVAIAYSDLNYKDALALTGKGNIIRTYPMIPGVDFAGSVEESSSASCRPGDSGPHRHFRGG